MQVSAEAHGAELPSIDDTIAAMSILGRILDQLRARLASAERRVLILEQEKRSLCAELSAIVEAAASHKRVRDHVRHLDQESRLAPFDEAMFAFIKGIDTSFGMGVARH